MAFQSCTSSLPARSLLSYSFTQVSTRSFILNTSFLMIFYYAFISLLPQLIGWYTVLNLASANNWSQRSAQTHIAITTTYSLFQRFIWWWHDWIPLLPWDFTTASHVISQIFSNINYILWHYGRKPQYKIAQDDTAKICFGIQSLKLHCSWQKLWNFL